MVEEEPCTCEPIPARIRREKRTVEAMLRIYCRGHHGARADPCESCGDLLRYAFLRLDRCPFRDEKPTCVRCAVHCYRPEMKERIRDVMRYAGPRMIYRHPILAVLHKMDGLRGRTELQRQAPCDEAPEKDPK